MCLNRLNDLFLLSLIASLTRVSDDRDFNRYKPLKCSKSFDCVGNAFFLGERTRYENAQRRSGPPRSGSKHNLIHANAEMVDADFVSGAPERVDTASEVRSFA